MNKSPKLIERRPKASGILTEDSVLAFVPDAFAGDDVPIPGAQLPGGQREAAALLALQQTRIRRGELSGAIGDTTFELLVELLELPRFAVKVGEYPHLGAQHLRDHRHRHVVDRAHVIAANAVGIIEQ